MIRTALCIGLSAASLLLGLYTAVVQSENHERGLALNTLKEECTMLEAINGDRSEQILERDYGPVARPATPIEARAVNRTGATP